MMHHFVDDHGRRWRVETSGLQRDVMGLKTVGVWFIDEVSDWRVYGGLNPADVERPTDQRLRDALLETLRDQIADKPVLIKLQGQPVEMFHINDARYVRLVRDPSKAQRHGYIGTESLTTFDEVALRDELRRLEFTDNQTNAAIAVARLTFTRSGEGTAA
jgi:hypothetical protein